MLYWLDAWPLKVYCLNTLHFVADGRWSSWMTNSSSLCSQTCTRRVVYTRACTNTSSPLRGNLCNGSHIKNLTEKCSGDYCGEWKIKQLTMLQCTYFEYSFLVDVHTWNVGPVELFLYPASSTSGLKRLRYVISCLWNSAYKRSLAANYKE